jgi:hypothetical protein
MVKRYRGGLITANLALTVVGNYTNARAYSFAEYGKAKASGITFTSPPPMPMQFLLVAGGGAGGNDPVNADGGGGGAGGFLEYANVFFSSATTYTITVGAGGTAPGVLGDGADGSNTTITSGPSFNYITYGGGGGGAVTPDPAKGAGRWGGSGGGSGAYNQGKLSTGSGVPGQGNPGGLGTEQPAIDFRCAGGGGATQAGQSGPTNGAGYKGGWGGRGAYTTITGSNVSYAGGGAGYAYTPSGPTSGLGNGGDGGGGGRTSVNPQSANAPDGLPNSGGGGATNASGGAGVVVLRYPTASRVSTVVTTGNPNVIYAESNVIYRFWQSGTFAWY